MAEIFRCGWVFAFGSFRVYCSNVFFSNDRVVPFVFKEVCLTKYSSPYIHCIYLNEM